MRTAPFELKADLALTHAHGGSYFDAKMLASYFVSAGNFVHPVSRRDVRRDECERLDAFLKDARKAVTTAFDHREEYTAATASGRLDRLRAEAEGLMRTLFTLRTAGRPSTSRGRAAAERDGALAMVDDDARPGHAAPAAFDDAEPFPALGGGNDCRHNNRFAHLHGHGAISLLGDITTADADFLIAHWGGYFMFYHVSVASA